MRKNWTVFLSMLAFSAVLYSCGEGGEMEGNETMDQEMEMQGENENMDQEMEMQGDNENMDQEMSGEEIEGME